MLYSDKFKIKIQCTHLSQLNYCDKKITQKQIYNAINNGLIFHNIEDSYIDKIMIVHKKSFGKKTTTKTFECLTRAFLRKCDFIKFIYIMQLSGFQSHNDSQIIQFIDAQTNEVIYNYFYNEILEAPIFEPELRKKNNSSYTCQTLYSKTQKQLF